MVIYGDLEESGDPETRPQKVSLGAVQEIHEIYPSERHIRGQIPSQIHNSLRSCLIALKVRKMESL